ncbi:unnamed protein product [Camellia sinensis]
MAILSKSVLLLALSDSWSHFSSNMKFGSKKVWKLKVPFRLKGKSATRFCIFPKVKKASYGPGNTPVYLNVYDLTHMNGYVYWAGFGIFHSGVEVWMDDRSRSRIAAAKGKKKKIQGEEGVGGGREGGFEFECGQKEEVKEKKKNSIWVLIVEFPSSSKFEAQLSVHGVEYAFGAHDYPSSGVFEVEPRQCPGFKFRKSILIGTTCLDTVQVREFMERHSTNYNGDTYHLIVKNCNHFCKDICYKLTGKTIPKWVNRLAKLERSESNCKSIEAQAEPLLWGQVENRIGVKSRRLVVKDDLLGSIFNCVLPKALKISAVEHDPSYKACDSEKRRLTTAFSCLSSISTRQRQLSTSSLFLQSPLKGCLPPWELRKSNNGSLKER